MNEEPFVLKHTIAHCAVRVTFHQAFQSVSCVNSGSLFSPIKLKPTVQIAFESIQQGKHSGTCVCVRADTFQGLAVDVAFSCIR
jgi:hypothetical protein